MVRGGGLVLMLVLLLPLFAGCLDEEAAPGPSDEPASFGMPPSPSGDGDGTERAAAAGDAPADEDENGGTLVVEKTFSGSFSPTDGATGPVNDLRRPHRHALIEEVHEGVPVGVFLVVSYERNKTGAIGLTEPIEVSVDHPFPPFIRPEAVYEDGALRYEAAFTTDGPVDVVVTPTFPYLRDEGGVAVHEGLDYVVEARILWYFDAVPAGVPVALEIDPAKKVPRIEPVGETNASYLLFGPDGARVARLEAGAPLPLDAGSPAGTYIVGTPAPGGPALFRLFDVAGIQALAWRQEHAPMTDVGAEGYTVPFTLPQAAWAFAIELSGVHVAPAGHGLTLHREGVLVYEDGCEACSAFRSGVAPALLYFTDALDVPLPEGAYEARLTGHTGEGQGRAVFYGPATPGATP